MLKDFLESSLNFAPFSHVDNSSDAFTTQKKFKRFIDLLQWHVVRNELLDLQLSVEIFLDKFWYAVNAFVASKPGSFQSATSLQVDGHQLHLGALSNDSDQHTNAVAECSRLERLSHNLNISNTLKRVIDTTAGYLAQMFLNGFAGDFSCVDEFSRAEFFGHFKLRWVDVDCDDSRCSRIFAAHDDGKSDRSKPPNSASATGLDLGGVNSGAVASRDATAQQTDFIKRRLIVDLAQIDCRHDGVFGEGRAAEESAKGLTATAETRSSIRQQAHELSFSEPLAKVGRFVLTNFTFFALWKEQSDDMVADLEIRNTFTN